MAFMYEMRIYKAENSEDAFKEIARIFCVSEQSVRQAVTQHRKKYFNAK
jgi:hypothetical protein